MSETRCSAIAERRLRERNSRFRRCLCLIFNVLVAGLGSLPIRRHPPALVACCAAGADSSLFLYPPNPFRAGNTPARPSITMRSFRLTERRARPGCLEILVEGEVDLAVADQLEQALERALSQSVLIGLQACEFVDSTQVHRVLSITGPTENELVFATLDEALSEIICS
jgi:hypothetical protein